MAPRGFQQLELQGKRVKGECRTLQRHPNGLEELDSQPLVISRWRARGQKQQWICLELGRVGLAVFVPLEFFERGVIEAAGIAPGPVLLEK